MNCEVKKVIVSMQNEITSVIPISDLDLPANVIKFYIDSGLEELYPPQSDAVRHGLLDGRNILASIATASGKTLLAEMAMLKSIIENDGKALYIVPLIALASEKYDRFSQFASLGVRVGISTGDFSSKTKGNQLGDHDIIVVTSEKADSLMRNQTEWMRDISVVVVDEVHLLGDPHRGPTLDVTMTKLRLLNPRAQVIALSATIGNAAAVAGWLDAELVVSDWRPIELLEGVGFKSRVVFDGGCPNRAIDAHTDSDPSINIVLDTINEGNQCIVFRSSRPFCEAFAKKFSEKENLRGLLARMLGAKRRSQLVRLADKVVKTSESTTADYLAACIRSGVAFHHAGLTSAQRRIVEDGFRQNKIMMLVSTTTLAAGLNLPARQVIIKEHTRYNGSWMEEIPVIEYKQMAGRAGRPHLDDHGESALIAKSDDELQTLLMNYVGGEPENIYSNLNHAGVLQTHVLASIVTGFAVTPNSILELFGETFYAHQNTSQDLNSTIRDCIDFLLLHEMLQEPDTITSQEPDTTGFSATQLGELVCRLYVDPATAATIVDGIRTAEHREMELTDFSILQLLCTTGDVQTRRNKLPLDQFIFEHAREIIDIPTILLSLTTLQKPGSPPTDKDTEAIAQLDDAFKESVVNASMLLDWIDEMKVAERKRKKSKDDESARGKTITQKFGNYEGDIHSLTSSTEWIMHATQEIAQIINAAPTTQNHVWVLERRVRYGVKAELIGLVGVKHIGRAYARGLFDSGVKTHEDFENNTSTLRKVLGNKTMEKVLKNLKIPFHPSSEPESTDPSCNYQATLEDFTPLTKGVV